MGTQSPCPSFDVELVLIFDHDSPPGFRKPRGLRQTAQQGIPIDGVSAKHVAPTSRETSSDTARKLLGVSMLWVASWAPGSQAGQDTDRHLGDGWELQECARVSASLPPASAAPCSGTTTTAHLATGLPSVVAKSSS